MAIDEKITDYTLSGGNPDLASLIDISEKIGGIFATRSMELSQLLTFLNSNLSFTVNATFYNNSGVTINKGDLVFIDGQVGGVATVSRVGSSYTNNSKFFISNETLLNTESGAFLYYGKIEAIDTSGFAPGDKLYWNTATELIENVEPADGIFVGVALDSQILGSIYFAPKREKGTPFNFFNSSIDAGDNKTSYIERYGSIALKDGSSIFMDRENDGVTETATFSTNYIRISATDESSGASALIVEDTFSPFNIFSQLIHGTVNGTKTTPLAMVNGRTLSEFGVKTFDGTTYPFVVREKVVASENFSPTNRGVKKIFQKINNGSSLIVDILEFTADGNIRFNDAYQFPIIDGSPNQVLKTDGSGNYGYGILQDNGSEVGIGTILNLAQFNVETSLKRFASRFLNYYIGSIAYGGYFASGGINSFQNYGIYSLASNSTLENIGGIFTATGVNSYAVQLSDGSEASGKFLKCITSNGKANWSNINERDVQIRTVTGFAFFGATFDFLCSSYLIGEFSGGASNVTITFNSPQEGQTYSLVFIQSASLINLTLPTGYWLNDVAPFNFSTELAIGERAMITATYLNSTWYFAVKKLQLV